MVMEPSSGLMENERVHVTQAQELYDYDPAGDGGERARVIAGVYFQVQLPWEVSQEDADYVYDFVAHQFDGVGEELLSSLSIALPDAILTSSGIVRSQDSPH